MKQLKKSIICFLLLPLIPILLSGCQNSITQGEVIEKEFTPSHTEVMLVPLVHSNGKTSYTTLVPFIYSYSDSWKITIQSYDKETGENSTATYRVTENVYNSVEIGSEFIYDENMKPNEFIKELVELVAKHGCTMEDIEVLFRSHSDKIVAEPMDNGEFDRMIRFEEGEDKYYYCFKDEGCHIIYHRFLPEDYADFDF